MNEEKKEVMENVEANVNANVNANVKANVKANEKKDVLTGTAETTQNGKKEPVVEEPVVEEPVVEEAVVEEPAEENRKATAQEETITGDANKNPKESTDEAATLETPLETEKEEPLKNTETVTPLDTKMDTLVEGITKLEEEFESKLRYDRHKEETIGNMHKELQEYKNDLVKSVLRPMLMDIILTVDNNATLVNNLKKEAELDPQDLLTQMAEISFEMEEILFRQGVETFQCKQTQFDPKRQKIVKTEITHQQQKDKTIAREVHKGYQWEGKMLCRERVNVYVYKPETKKQETASQETQNQETQNQENKN
ncbi:MAG: nucleotide exchange factor GrpE [bacterium]|nr:nucleotide exchange factor GrpE [bacterium]